MEILNPKVLPFYNRHINKKKQEILGVPHCVAQSDKFLSLKDNVTLNCVQ
jgi:hypothetical protein